MSGVSRYGVHGGLPHGLKILGVFQKDEPLEGGWLWKAAADVQLSAV